MARANNKCNRVFITVNLAIFLIVLNTNVLSGMCSPRVIRQVSGTGEAVSSNETMTAVTADNTTVSETPIIASPTETANSTINELNANAEVTPPPTISPPATDVNTTDSGVIPPVSTTATPMNRSSTSRPSSTPPPPITTTIKIHTTTPKGSASSVSMNVAYMSLAFIVLCVCNRHF